MFFDGDELLVPDFRVVTKVGIQMLVEVKSQRMDGTFQRQLKLSDGYVQKLKTYASHTGTALRFAIFWEEAGVWTLNCLEAFTAGLAGERQWSISFAHAFAASETASLGDRTIATWAPLRFRVLVDPEKSEPMPPGKLGTFRLVLAGLRLLSQDRLLSGRSAELAWRLIDYGKWGELRQEAHHDGDKLLWVDHVFGPEAPDDDELDPEGPALIGALSEMISTAYLRGAERTIHTTATDGVLEPGYMGKFIPDDFMSMKDELPLCILQLQPNFDHRDD